MRPEYRIDASTIQLLSERPTQEFRLILTSHLGASYASLSTQLNNGWYAYYAINNLLFSHPQSAKSSQGNRCDKTVLLKPIGFTCPSDPLV
ncbi:hypothetical protein EYR41_004278 [Orbilia oligospora]|uniref:Uncharacterized protein n=1 Tax=Orbilia oligospora TaxID=2813651 RepID=A0A8H2E6N6_ORBOL|nr:hypothetical protein TWF217_005722 [Orbilia oligospora]KAF3271882.1 hypothetical protein TWF128_000408 [Orbilia oligospora]KAF3293539.1 hypothetical protein TWF132_004507 [Orbilia oligospora]TGJ72379.1 hypothetical protein EYR41_004278 [Orbilia oligospora]